MNKYTGIKFQTTRETAFQIAALVGMYVGIIAVFLIFA